MAILPVDLITEIFLLLPAKSLLRFKSVCTLWYDLITDPYFARLHLERSLATKTNLHFVINSPMLHLTDFDTFENPVELDYPFKNPDHGGVFVEGSCHGLLYLSICDHHCSSLLYNPTTQTHRLLPFLPRIEPFDHGYCDFGFGYDTASGDYKCVRILQHLDRETGSFQSEVMVYSLRTDSWQRGPDVPYYFHYHNGNSIVFHDIIHWVGDYDTRVPQPIVAFDLRDETFSSLPLPDFDIGEYLHLHVGVLDGCLCLSVSYLYDCDVWIMKEYGRAGSWTRKFNIVKDRTYRHLQRPIGYSRSGKELFFRICLLQVACIDLQTMETSDVKVAHFVRCMDAHVCVENLLVLDYAEDNRVAEEQGRKKCKKKNRRRRRHKR